LTEGKFSFPIIHAINNNKNDLTLINILKERTTDVKTKIFAIELLEKFGSISYTYEKLKDLFEKFCKQLEQFEDNLDMYHLMNSFKIE
jgi:geranylgeranyl diphosphate synthase type 3